MNNNVKSRIAKDKFFTIAIFTMGIIALSPLILIIAQIFSKGFSILSWGFLTSLPKPPGESGSGIFNSILGTILLLIIATIISVPPGILVGIYLKENKNKFSRMLNIIVDVLAGVPSIVMGIIAYIWVVLTMGRFSAIAGGIALAFMMLPIIIKHTTESLQLIPFNIHEASYALGANYSQTLIKVVFPYAVRGIISGILLAMARVAGETAPLLFTAFGNPFVNINPLKPTDALPLTIFNYAMSPYTSWHKTAWGASLVLILIILIVNLITKQGRKKWNQSF